MAIDQVITGIGVDSAADNGKYVKYDGTTDTLVMDTPSGGSLIQSVSVTLSQSNVNNLHTTPVTFLAAQGANTVIQIVSFFWHYAYGTSAFAGGGNINIRYNNANDDMFNFTDYTGTVDYMVWNSNGVGGYNRPLSYGENLPITFGNAGSAITGGIDSTVTCTILYTIIST